MFEEPRVLRGHDGVDEVGRDLGKGHEIRTVRPDDEGHDAGIADPRRLRRNLHGLYQRFAASQRDNLCGSLDHLTSVDADLASQIQRVEVGEVDLAVQVGLEEALEHESTQVRHDGRRDTGEQLGAGNSRHAKLRLDFGQVVQFVAVLETEATLG